MSASGNLLVRKRSRYGKMSFHCRGGGSVVSSFGARTTFGFEKAVNLIRKREMDEFPEKHYQ